jgi:prepilin signal peptidase PulO-like enzyme (type II secretory pathway)
VKFFAVAGLWLTPLPMVVFLFLSGLFGVVFGLLWRLLGKGEYFPFGPALAVSLMVCVLWPGADGWLWEIGRWVQSIL